MSIISLPRGFHRKTSSSFSPNTMIDILFDYKNFLGEDLTIHKNPAKSNLSVAIMGASASGLLSGILLLKAGVKVTIYEASDRVGGRMYSSYPEGSGINKNVFELGCMRFPPTSTILFELFRQFKIKTQENFPDPGSYGVNTVLYYKNEKIAWPSPKSPSERSLPDNKKFKKLGYNFGCVARCLLGDPNNTDLIGPNIGILYNRWKSYQDDPTNTNKKNKLREAWQELITRYKNKSFYDALFELTQHQSNIFASDIPLPSGLTDAEAKRLWNAEDMDAFGALGIGSGGFGPLYTINFLELLRILANGWEDGQELVPNGIESLTRALEREFYELGGEIKLNRKLQFALNSQEISKDPNLIRPRFFQQKRMFCVGDPIDQNNYVHGVICATTTYAADISEITWAADTVDINLPNPLIHEDVKVAIRNLSLMTSSKFFIRVKNRFWEDKENYPDCPSNIQTDELPRGIYCLDYGSGTSGVILVSYVWGNDSIKLQAMSKRDRFDALVNAIECASPVFARGIRENCIYENDVEPFNNYIDWQCAAPTSPKNISQNYAYGAFKLDQPGQEPMCAAAFFNYKKPKGDGIIAPPLILSGDSVSWAGGWMEGALTTAVNAACGMLNILDKNALKENNPVSNISEVQYIY